jgi:hypothetical protein
MSETLVSILVIAIALVTLYGSALIITEHFWLGVILLIFLTPIFFIWAFFRGLTGK